MWGGWTTTDGTAGDGGVFDGAAWSGITGSGAPGGRRFHVGAWTGSVVVYWSGIGQFGEVNDGGRYNPATDTWTATNPVNSANNGQGITAVWTGTEMIVWGGLDDDFLFHYDGGRYDPLLDVWHPTGTMNVPAARGLHAAAWTGSEMIIWGAAAAGEGALPPGRATIRRQTAGGRSARSTLRSPRRCPCGPARRRSSGVEARSAGATTPRPTAGA